MRTLIPTLVLLAAPAAQAADLGATISLEMGTITNRDTAYDLFSNGDGMPSRGVRGGVRIGQNLSVLGGWHRVRRGAEVYLPRAAEAGTEFGSEQYVVMAYFADEFSLGAQAGLPIGKILFPYATADGMLLRQVVKLDEDPDTRQNPGQLVGAGLTPGLLALGGLELRTPTGDLGIQGAVFIEFGYSWFLTGNIGDFGQMQPGGFTSRGGLGLRF